jgi:hypothetical protein
MGKYIQKFDLNIHVSGSIVVKADSWSDAEKLELDSEFKETLEKEMKKALENIKYKIQNIPDAEVSSNSRGYTMIGTDDCIEE